MDGTYKNISYQLIYVIELDSQQRETRKLDTIKINNILSHDLMLEFVEYIYNAYNVRNIQRVVTPNFSYTRERFMLLIPLIAYTDSLNIQDM